jgi:hypothetical protein
MRSECASQRACACDGLRRKVNAINIESLPEEVDEVAPRAATGVENPHRRDEAPFQELVEEVYVDTSELSSQIIG